MVVEEGGDQLGARRKRAPKPTVSSAQPLTFHSRSRPGSMLRGRVSLSILMQPALQGRIGQLTLLTRTPTELTPFR